VGALQEGERTRNTQYFKSFLRPEGSEARIGGRGPSTRPGYICSGKAGRTLRKTGKMVVEQEEPGLLL